MIQTTQRLIFCGILLSALSCRLLTPQVPDTPPPETPATSRHPAGLTLREAWDLAEPNVRAWSEDGAFGEQWSCWGTLTPQGRCTRWHSMAASPTQEQLLLIDVQVDGVSITPSAVAPAVLDRVRQLPFMAMDDEAFLDSPAAVETALSWLAANDLPQADTRIRSLSLWTEPTVLQECHSQSPVVYKMQLGYPSGQLCIDPTTGQVTGHTYENLEN